MESVFRNTLLKTTCNGSNGSPMILTLQLNITKGPTKTVRAYKPNGAPSTEERDEFHGNLSAIIDALSKSEQIFLNGENSGHEHLMACNF